MQNDKLVRDIVRMRVATKLRLTRSGESNFMADVMRSASKEDKAIIRDELANIEKYLETKTEAVGEA